VDDDYEDDEVEPVEAPDLIPFEPLAEEEPKSFFDGLIDFILGLFGA
jgi:hypothetical protein